MKVPYSGATSGQAARTEILKYLKHFGCESVGFMDEFSTHSLLLAFTWRGTQIQLRASAQGWANAYLKQEPWNSYRKCNRQAYETKALDKGMVAINSILRDWVKGQVTAIETGVLSFERVFMPFMLTADGTPLIEHMQKLLPQRPEGKDDE